MKYLNNYATFRLNENTGFLTKEEEILKKLMEITKPASDLGGPVFQPELAGIHLQQRLQSHRD